MKGGMAGQTPSGVLRRARWGPPDEAQGRFGRDFGLILAEQVRVQGLVGVVDRSTALCHGCNSMCGLWELCVGTTLPGATLEREVVVVVDESISTY